MNFQGIMSILKMEQDAEDKRGHRAGGWGLGAGGAGLANRSFL